MIPARLALRWNGRPRVGPHRARGVQAGGLEEQRRPPRREPRAQNAPEKCAGCSTLHSSQALRRDLRRHLRPAQCAGSSTLHRSQDLRPRRERGIFDISRPLGSPEHHAKWDSALRRRMLRRLGEPVTRRATEVKCLAFEHARQCAGRSPSRPAAVPGL